LQNCRNRSIVHKHVSNFAQTCHSGQAQCIASQASAHLPTRPSPMPPVLLHRIRETWLQCSHCPRLAVVNRHVNSDDRSATARERIALHPHTFCFCCNAGVWSRSHYRTHHWHLLDGGRLGPVQVVPVVICKCVHTRVSNAQVSAACSARVEHKRWLQLSL
jgi:hypothetical protein